MTACRHLPVAMILAVTAACSSANAPADRAADGAKASQSAATLRLVNLQTAPQGAPHREGACSAVLPQGWTMSAGPDGNATDLIGEHGRARAAWGIRGVNTAMRGFYGDLYGPPDVSTLATASEIAHAPARYTGAAKDVGGFTERAFAGGDIAGITLYLSYAAPLPGQYVLSTYFAYVDRGAENLLPTAEAVMTTNSCQTQLRPPPPSSASSAKSASRSRSSSGDSEDDKLKDYNAQLGTQWAHSSTGQHYLLDYASQWNDTGPDGPGYYIKSGNSVEKLTNGW